MQYVGYLSFSLHQDCANSLHATLEPMNQFMLVLGALSAHNVNELHQSSMSDSSNSQKFYDLVNC